MHIISTLSALTFLKGRQKVRPGPWAVTTTRGLPTSLERKYEQVLFFVESTLGQSLVSRPPIPTSCFERDDYFEELVMSMQDYLWGPLR